MPTLNGVLGYSKPDPDHFLLDSNDLEIEPKLLKTGEQFKITLRGNILLLRIMNDEIGATRVVAVQYE
jgi:hypothetical protein